MKKLFTSILVVAIGTATAFTQNVQQQLDNCVPIEEILQTNPVDSLYGKTYQGGLIFYVDTTDFYGIVAAPTDISSGVPWSLNNDIIPGTHDASIISSSLSIVNNQGPGNYAAYLCDTSTLNGYTNWYLPSSGAVEQMYLNL